MAIVDSGSPQLTTEDLTLDHQQKALRCFYFPKWQEESDWSAFPDINCKKKKLQIWGREKKHLKFIAIETLNSGPHN